MAGSRLQYKRVILKITGEVLAGGREFGIEPQTVRLFVEQIKEIHGLV
jgi:uridylate kinase